MGKKLFFSFLGLTFILFIRAIHKREEYAGSCVFAKFDIIRLFPEHNAISKSYM